MKLNNKPGHAAADDAPPSGLTACVGRWWHVVQERRPQSGRRLKDIILFYWKELALVYPPNPSGLDSAPPSQSTYVGTH
ncbi:hypothetical protein CDV36_013151 [Fusarium kuroshium]|uniref:Uncharacterized protein n=1 Tax=Fusarium kuroshium TaxID=2010991 RepID=A0A3M2RPW0_9HYPO|nr:hypothetical protein CDV36_013151 [Fusarium kuroshium]